MKRKQCLMLAVRGLFYGRSRRRYTLVTAFCIFIVMTLLDSFSFYKEGAIKARRTMVESSLPEKIRVEVPSDMLHDRSMWFTGERIESISAVRGVKRAFPNIKTGGILQVPGEEKKYDAYIESTIPEDPGFESKKMLWGRDVNSVDCSEIVVSEELLRRMWPKFNEGEIPRKLCLVVERGSGTNRTLNQEFNLVGISRGGEIDDAYLPLRFMENLEIWLTSASESVPQPGMGSGKPVAGFSSARVFALGEFSQEEIERHAKSKNLNISLKNASKPFDEVYIEGDPWLIVGRDGTTLSDADVKRIRSDLAALGIEGPDVRFLCSTDIMLECEGVQLKASVRALPMKEGQAPAVTGLSGNTSGLISRLGRVIISKDFATKLPVSKPVEAVLKKEGSPFAPLLAVAGVTGRIREVGDFDILCSTETLGYFLTDVPLEKGCIVWTSDPLLSKRFVISSGNPNLAREGPEFFFKNAGFAGAVPYGSHEYCSAALGMADKFIGCKFIPDKVFNEISVPPPQRNPKALPIVLAFDPNKLDGRGKSIYDSNDYLVWTKKHNAYVAGVMLGDDCNEIWLPYSRMDDFPELETRKSHFRVQPKYDVIAAYDRSSGEQKFRSEYFLIMLPGGEQEVNKVIDRVLGSYRPLTLETVEIAALPVMSIKNEPLGKNKQLLPVICMDRSLARFPLGWAREYASMRPHEMIVAYGDSPSRYSAEMTIGGRMVNFRVADDSTMPDNGLIIVSPSAVVLHPSKFYSFPKAQLQVKAEVKIPDAKKLEAVAKRLGGYSLRPLFEVKRRRLVCYEVVDNLAKDGKMDGSLMSILKNEQIFVDACPNIETEARVSIQVQGKTELSRTFKLFGSQAHDLAAKMNGGLVAGGWISDKSGQYQIVLPQTLLKENHVEPNQVVGRSIAVEFTRGDGQDSSRPSLEIAFVVAGVTGGSNGFVPMQVANDVSLWKTGLLNYDGATGFVRPEDIYRSQGRTTCTVYANDMDSVRPVVDELRKMGYFTEDSLHEQEGLIHFIRSISAFVLVMVAGSFFLGTIAIASLIWMNTWSTIHEMGVLRSLGVASGRIRTIFIFVAVLITFLGCLPSIIALGCFEPYARKALVSGGMAIAQYATGSILDFQYWDIHLYSFAACMISALIGVSFSAWWVSNAKICQLFHDRE